MQTTLYSNDYYELMVYLKCQIEKLNGSKFSIQGNAVKYARIDCDAIIDKPTLQRTYDLYIADTNGADKTTTLFAGI